MSTVEKALVSGAGGGCFVAGSLVSTPTGKKPIEELKVGDAVYAYDDKWDLTPAKVTAVFEHPDEEVWEFNFWGGLQTSATPVHMVLNQYNGFVELGALGLNDGIIDVEGHIRFLTGKKRVKDATVYNLTVEPHHTFIVDGIRVHNGGRSHALDIIEGSGGGGGKGGGSARAPTEDPNTLQSRSIARIVDLIGEGQIVGLENGLKDVYLDETPVQASDGTYNFQGLRSLEWRAGTPNQTSIPGFNTVETEKIIETEVKQSSGPLTRSINDLRVTHARVRIRIPSLTETNTGTGDVKGSEVSLKIEVRPDGGSYQTVRTATKTDPMTTTVTGIAAVGMKISAFAETEVFNIYTAPANTDPYPDRPTIQYRPVGGAWVDMPVKNHSQAMREEIRGGRNRRVIRYYRSDVTAEITGLAAGQYEYRVVGGTAEVATESQAVSSFISGKNTAPYEDSYVFELTGTGPWDVKVTRLTEDSSNLTIQNATVWAGMTEIIDQPLSYPNSAYVALEADAEHFGGRVPKRAYKVKGLYVQVPTNYDPIARTYSGIWDGTFKMAWTDCPPWILYDIITHNRYGLGEFVDDTAMDKATLYAVAQYCDQLVPDGFGGQEPRFRFTGVIQTREEAYDVVNAIVSNFRAMAFWASNMFTVAQDSPRDTDMLIGPANVIDGEFQYEGIAEKARHNAVAVTWNDPNDMYKPQVEYVEDNEDISARGLRSTDVVAYGCTSQGQAHRFGKWILFTEKYEREIVSYKASFDHGLAMPGMVVGISDPTYQGATFAGRVVGTSANTITLDREIELEFGKSYQIGLVGTDQDITYIDVLDGVGTFTTLNLASAPPSMVDGSMYTIIPNDAVPRTFRIVAVSEEEPNVFAISGTQYVPGKFDLVELGIDLPEVSYTQLSTGVIEAPGPITTSESLHLVNTQVKTQLSISWEASPDTRILYYEVNWRLQGSAWKKDNTSEFSYDIPDVQAGMYDIAVYAVTSEGRSGGSFKDDLKVFGKTAPPDDVINFTADREVAGVQLNWEKVTSLDLVGYEIREGDDWENATLVNDNLIGTSFYVSLFDDQDHTYLIKAVDELGIYSETATAVVASVSAPADVEFFEVVQKADDNLQFFWIETTEPDLVYEIREGLTWTLAQTVATVAGDKHQALLPGSGERTYWIKAKSRVGLYSANARFAKITKALFQDRNVVLEYDNKEDTSGGTKYTGTHFQMVVDGDNLVMAETQPGLYATVGEHYFNVDLGETIRARNWLEAEPYFVLEVGPDWDDFDFPWDDPRANVAWDQNEDTNSVVIEKKIAMFVGPADASELYGFALNEDTDDFRGVLSATEEDNVTYENARTGKGILVEDITRVHWQTMSVPSTFRWGFNLKLKDISVYEGSVSIFAMLKDNSSGRFLKIGYDGGSNILFAEDNVGNKTEVSVDFTQDNDLVFIGIEQAGAYRELYFKSELLDSSGSNQENHGALGSYDRLYLYQAA